jgi:hypothetical protein
VLTSQDAGKALECGGRKAQTEVPKGVTDLRHPGLRQIDGTRVVLHQILVGNPYTPLTQPAEQHVGQEDVERTGGESPRGLPGASCMPNKETLCELPGQAPHLWR